MGDGEGTQSGARQRRRREVSGHARKSGPARVCARGPDLCAFACGRYTQKTGQRTTVLRAALGAGFSNLYVVNDEFIVAAGFGMFCFAIYNLAGPHLTEYLDEKLDAERTCVYCCAACLPCLHLPCASIGSSARVCRARIDVPVTAVERA
jgi:hypothetical protein